MLQYLTSSASWGRALAGGGGTGQDAPLAAGAHGVLFVDIPRGPAEPFRMVSVALDGIPLAIRKRIRGTPAIQDRLVAEWPLPKVIRGPIYLASQGADHVVDSNSIRFGHDWLLERGEARYNMTKPFAPGVAVVPAALLLGELNAKKIADLGPLGT